MPKKSTKQRAVETLNTLKTLGKVESIKQVMKIKEGNTKYLKKLNDTHKKIVEQRVLYGRKPEELSNEFGCSEKWVIKICRSDVGVRYAKELLDAIDIKIIRQHLQFAASLGTPIINKILSNFDEGKDGITLLERGKFALEVQKAAGVFEPTTHKFEFEHKFKKLGEVIEKAGQVAKTIEAEIVTKKITDEALREE